MFQPVPNNVSFPSQEEEVLRFWNDRQIYQKSLDGRAGSPKFIFYEGPPTANGMPHPGHCLTRAIKDVFPRYRTMRGYSCERKAGWDTHGLPVEVEVCKEMGIHSKEEIESFGVEPFIHKCQQSVWRYMQEWEQLTQRIGFWLKLEEAYVTYHQSYVESVWWSLKNLFDRGLLYQGHKIVWWWAQGGTALSAGEVGQGYKNVADPSVFVFFPLVDRPDTSLLVWTTTPWTLPSNQFAAVHKEIEYATVFEAESNRRFILAADVVERIAEKTRRELTIESKCSGKELVGLRYTPPFDFYHQKLADKQGKLKDGGSQHVAWRVVAADFVTTESGSGLVHEAPAFGEVDYELLMCERDRFEPGEGPEMICAVAPNGEFTDEAPDFKGMWVKDADKPIIAALKKTGLLFFQDQYLHEYPFCWRAEDDPLIQYPRHSWFIRTTKFRDDMLANNARVNWLPDHIRDGRFGNFLESNVDWALSRERYWGTPLPIWVCDKTGEKEAIGCYDELLKKPGLTGTEVWEAAKANDPELVEDLKIHKPYIDHVTYDSPFEQDGRMQRVTEVIDCWYDSGAMPFAQWGYPHQGKEKFDEQFPADFISEAIDQTRGWFYSLLSISTMLFGKDSEKQEPIPHPYQNCIVLGLMLAEVNVCNKCQHRNPSTAQKCEECGGSVSRKTEKMSKSKRNYKEPQGIFDTYGADALRWYFFANQPPWTSIIYSERNIKESIPEFLLRLWNVYSFFVLYANIDKFNPEEGVNGDSMGGLECDLFANNAGYRAVSERSELDRWVVSELNSTLETVIDRMDAYDNYAACVAITSFVDALSNWYVRRSRDRFWSSDAQSTDKLDGYWTLYKCLVTTTKMIAPFVPFLAEAMWQNLAGVFDGKATESVHLCDYPKVETTKIDRLLSSRMSMLREIASLGRAARMEAKLKVRQPLAGVTVVLNDGQQQAWLQEHDEILKTELNVKRVEYTTDADEYVSYLVQPNFKRVGPRVGKLMPQVKKLLGEAEGATLLHEMNETGRVTLDIDGQEIELDNEDIQVRLQAKDGWAAAQGKQSVVVLSTELSPELIREGMARDIVRLVQDRRKELDLQFTDRINLSVVTDSEELQKAIEENEAYIKKETLTITLSNKAGTSDNPIEREIAGFEVEILISIANDDNPI